MLLQGEDALAAQPSKTERRTAVGHVQVAAADKGHHDSSSHEGCSLALAKLLIDTAEGLREGRLELVRAAQRRAPLLHTRCSRLVPGSR